jgi:xylulokinase
VGVSASDLTSALGETVQAPSSAFCSCLISPASARRTTMPGIRGAFLGLGHESDRRAMTQAVMEGVAFAVRDSHEALKAAGTQLIARHGDRRRLALAITG